MKAQEILDTIKERLNSGQSIQVADGAFGDSGKVRDWRGVVEGTYQDTNGGIVIKYFGCDFLYKGFPERQTLQGLGLAKAMISIIPRETLGRSWALKASLLWMFLFQKNKLYHFLNVYFSSIYRHEIQTLGIDSSKFNSPTREIKRTVDLVSKRHIEEKEYIVDTPLLGDHAPSRITNYEYLKLIANFTEFFCLFIELDSAYRWPLQDGLENINKENIKKDVINELRRIFDLMLERSQPSGSVESARNKIKHASKLGLMFLKFNPLFRNFVRDFFLELDLNKVKLDENDWYFVLNRKAYNYRGMSLEERLKEKERVDRERGHIRLTVDDLLNPNGEMVGWDIKAYEQ